MTKKTRLVETLNCDACGFGETINKRFKAWRKEKIACPERREPMITFFVPGIPQQQGSKSPFIRGGRAVMCDANAKKLNPWRKAVALEARKAWGNLPPLTEAVEITIHFYYPLLKKQKEIMPKITRPDIDKLERAIFDALTGIIVDDDCRFWKSTKTKTHSSNPAGALIEIGWKVWVNA